MQQYNGITSLYKRSQRRASLRRTQHGQPGCQDPGFGSGLLFAGRQRVLLGLLLAASCPPAPLVPPSRSSHRSRVPHTAPRLASLGPSVRRAPKPAREPRADGRVAARWGRRRAFGFGGAAGFPAHSAPLRPALPWLRAPSCGFAGPCRASRPGGGGLAAPRRCACSEVEEAARAAAVAPPSALA